MMKRSRLLAWKQDIDAKKKEAQKKGSLESAKKAKAEQLKRRCRNLGKQIPELERIKDKKIFGRPKHTSLKISETEYPAHASLKIENLMCLQRGVMLTDEVMNIYLAILQKDVQDMKSKVYFLNTYFYTKLTSPTGKKFEMGSDNDDPLETYSYGNVRRWTKAARLRAATGNLCSHAFELDLLVFPIHDEERAHWMLGAVDFKEKRIVVYNSDEESDFELEVHAAVKTLKKWLQDEWKDKRGEGAGKPPEFDYWQPPTQPPQQQNAVECGLFCLAYAHAMLHIAVSPTMGWPQAKGIMQNAREGVLNTVLGQAGLTKAEKPLPSIYDMMSQFN